jgi:hypothetical protein
MMTKTNVREMMTKTNIEQDKDTEKNNKTEYVKYLIYSKEEV